MECHNDMYMEGSVSEFDTVKIVQDDFHSAVAYRSRLSKDMENANRTNSSQIWKVSALLITNMDVLAKPITPPSPSWRRAEPFS